MKKLVCITTALVTLTASIVSCAPETINNNDDEQLNTEIQGVSRGVKRPGTQGS